MSIDDYYKHFQQMQLVHLDLNALYFTELKDNLETKKIKWISLKHDGAWIKGQTAGGNYKKKLNSY